MGLSLYTIVYLFTNAFNTYVTFSFMKVFFKDNYINKKAVIIFYALFYIITSSVYIFFPSFLMNIISSLGATFLITLCYQSKFLKKLIVTILNYLTFFICEAIVACIIGVSNISLLQNTYLGNSFSLIMVEILAFIFVKIIGKFKNLNCNTPMPWSFMITIILVPLISIFFEIQLFMQENISEIIYILSLICVLILNFIIFYLYDSNTKTFNEKIKTEMIKQEIEYYHKQSELIQKNSEEIKHLRHDMKNHLIAIKELAKSKDTDKILEYISTLYDKIDPSQMYCSTGIFEIDSVLNYKLSQAEKKGISISSEIMIPSDLKIKSHDFVTILGNLIDNAIEATNKLDDNKYIKLNIKYSKGTIFIAVKNSYNGKLNIFNNEYRTTKDEDGLHGIGIKSIETAVKKYNGDMIISHTNNEFYIKILLIA